MMSNAAGGSSLPSRENRRPPRRPKRRPTQRPVQLERVLQGAASLASFLYFLAQLIRLWLDRGR
jgi:hypothetical protein